MVHYNLCVHSYNPASLGFLRLPFAISLFYGARLDALPDFHDLFGGNQIVIVTAS